MNKSRCVPLVCLLSVSALPAGGLAQDTIIYEPHQMQADLTKFKAALTAVHPGTFTHQSPQEFDRLVERLAAETAEPLEGRAFYAIVLRLIASLHDGHTQAYAFGALGAVINNLSRLPFTVYVRDERVFLVKDLGSQGIREGSELLAIDGQLSSDVLSRILQHYSSDGTSRSGMYHWLGGPYRPFHRIYPEVFGAKPSYELVYRDRETKEVVTTRVTALSPETFEAIQSERYPSEDTPESAVDYSVDEDARSAYLRIGRFVKDGFDEPERTYPDLYERFFEEIAAREVRNLIVDLRDNGGGKASNAAYLLQYFIDRPLRPAREITTMGDDEFFLRTTGDTLDLDRAFGLSRRADDRFEVMRTDVLRDLMTYEPIDEHGFSGALVVLINGGTSSAAAVAAGLLREHAGALLVGEETFGYAGLSNGVRASCGLGESVRKQRSIYLCSMPLTIWMSTFRGGPSSRTLECQAGWKMSSTRTILC